MLSFCARSTIPTALFLLVAFTAVKSIRADEQHAHQYERRGTALSTAVTLIETEQPQSSAEQPSADLLGVMTSGGVEYASFSQPGGGLLAEIVVTDANDLSAARPTNAVLLGQTTMSNGVYEASYTDSQGVSIALVEDTRILPTPGATQQSSLAPHQDLLESQPAMQSHSNDATSGFLRYAGAMTLTGFAAVWMA